MASKGNANRETLSDRMKEYEAVTTSSTLVRKLPIYARIDMRAGHTFCRGLDKPFDNAYSTAMKAVTAYLVDKTGAIVGYTQSDEISLVWIDASKVPFENRLFKLESVLAGMASSAFAIYGCRGKLNDKIQKHFPCFDCRVMNLPTLAEAANMLMWREQDAVKNSITLLALEHFSTKQIHKKNSNDKVKMLADIGVDYYCIPEDLRNGAYFHRVVGSKTLSDEELEAIPEKFRPKPNTTDGKVAVTRSCVQQYSLGGLLTDMDMEKKIEVLFGHENKGDEGNEA